MNAEPHIIEATVPALQCPVCKSESFLEFNGRANARCARCLTMERTRLLWMVLERFKLFRPGLRVLHIAPELAFAKRFSDLCGERYHACDIDPDRYKSRYTTLRPLDLCRDLVKLPSRCFDLIIHSHVLEHIRGNVEEVLGELERLTAPGGHHFFCVPVRGEETQEDISDELTPMHRLMLFGQEDHMRIFGTRSLAEMLARVWGEGDHVIKPLELFGEDALRKAAIPEEAWRGISSHSMFHRRKPTRLRLIRQAVSAPATKPAPLDENIRPESDGRPRVIFHIGMPKTGTTAIQRWLATNREAMRDCGLDYWRASENHSELAFLAFASERRIGLKQLWFQRPDGGGMTKPLASEAFANFVSALGGNTGFVSAEALWTLTKPEIADFGRQLSALGVDTEIMCWVRMPAQYFNSTFQQRARRDLAMSDLDHRPERLVPLSYARLDEWIDVFGGRVHVFPYRDDMLAALHEALAGLGIATKPPATGETILNTSMSLAAAKALMALADAQRGKPARRSSRLQAALQRLAGEPFAVPEFIARAIGAPFAKEEAYLAERFGFVSGSDAEDCVDDHRFFTWDAEEVGRLLLAINELLLDDKPKGGGSSR